MTISLSLHVFGIALWIGGLIFVLTLAGQVSAALLRKAMFKVVHPGMGLVLVTGVYQLLTRGMKFYMSQPWMHTKLTVVIILIVLTIVAGKKLDRPTPYLLGLVALLALLTISLTQFGQLGIAGAYIIPGQA